MSDSVSTRQQQQQLVLSGTGPTSESLDLEDAVVVDILSRLPPKSLLRFRCVCKAWRALISDPYFIREHLTRANNSHSYSLLVRKISTFRSIDSKALFKCSSLDDGPVPSRELFFPVNDPRIVFDHIEIIGSCNGLICLGFCWSFSVINLIMLWNPCTREIKVLPKLPVEDTFGEFYGFGYDSTTDDYKVIVGDFCYTSLTFGQGASYEYTVLVYTVRTGSWRGLQRLKRSFKVDGFGCLMNGALYWLDHVWDGNVLIACKLVSFDLTQEKFHEFGSPCYPISTDRYKYLVATEGKFRNSLASYSWGTETEFMMWVMKEAGVEKSWNEVIKIPEEVLPVTLDRFLKPLCISNDGVALFEVCELCDEDASFLTLYDPKENRCRNVTEPCVSEAVPYVETLVSPFTSTRM